MNFADLYGPGKSMPGGRPEEAPSAEASGPPGGSVKPALFWVSIIAILVGTRLLWEYAAE